MQTKAPIIKKGDRKYYNFKECEKGMTDGVLGLIAEEAESLKYANVCYAKFV
ncbi:MAG: hypothetical protein JRJ00_15475 [Deltaproteobacteria bacterium]|nr:hypothetical protein [Deltaproteobacteria bacterium]